MTTRGARRAGAKAIRAELDRVLAFPDMKASQQMSAFLRFVVEEALAGTQDWHEHQLLATETRCLHRTQRRLDGHVGKFQIAQHFVAEKQRNFLQ